MIISEENPARVGVSAIVSLYFILLRMPEKVCGAFFVSFPGEDTILERLELLGCDEPFLHEVC